MRERSSRSAPILARNFNEEDIMVINARLVNECAEMTAQHVLERLSQQTGELPTAGETREFIELVQPIVRAGIETYVEFASRMQQRLRPLSGQEGGAQ
jgi:hypothetical protein